MRCLLAVLFCQLVLCVPLFAAQQSEITGAVAYTEIVRFDYTKDGTRNQVQFWLEFKGSPAVGEPGEAGYKPESGSIYYYLVDLEQKKPVESNWLMGFSMMEGPPPRGPYPMKDIDIRGNRSTFEAFGMKWSIIDGGKDYTKDIVKIDDGFMVRDMKLFNGDLKIVDATITDYSSYQECMKCHEAPAAEMIAKGGKHNEMGCDECHTCSSRHPKEKKSYMECVECHEPHSDQMAEDACSQCHRAHRATEVTYAFNVQSQHCAVCHQESADALASSQSKHSGMACALCHQKRHKASSSCQYCHGGTHPEHVMKKTGICAACHHTAHDLESAHAK